MFPARCVVCDDITDFPGLQVCNKCKGKIVYIKSPTCMKCGKQLNKEEREYCSDCEKINHLYVCGTALYDYGSMSDSIFRFKYAGRMEYATYYGRDLYVQKEQWLTMIQPDAIIPVPIHGTRMRKRGYNQAELISTELSRCCGIPVNTTLIRRTAKTLPLKNLTHSERQNNLKKAFKIWQNDVKLNTIVIIDDVYTTGSTIDSMTSVLMEAGVAKVYFMALTIGRGI